MRYTELTQVIEDAARSVGYVNSIYRGSPYDLWNNTGVQYVSVCHDLQSASRDATNDSLHRYNVILYAADRLTTSADNEPQAWDASEAVIDVVIAALRSTTGVMAVETSELLPFSQDDGFADNLAGYYTTLTIEVTTDITLC